MILESPEFRIKLHCLQLVYWLCNQVVYNPGILNSKLKKFHIFFNAVWFVYLFVGFHIKNSSCRIFIDKSSANTHAHIHTTCLRRFRLNIWSLVSQNRRVKGMSQGYKTLAGTGSPHHEISLKFHVLKSCILFFKLPQILHLAEYVCFNTNITSQRTT